MDKDTICSMIDKYFLQFLSRETYLRCKIIKNSIFPKLFRLVTATLAIHSEL